MLIGSMANQLWDWKTEMRRQPQDSQGLRLTLQYLGERFDSHMLSCADAQDLAVFERMLTKIADRRIKSSGKEGLGGFSVGDAVYFGFESISKGSAVAEISVRPRLADSRAGRAYADFGLDPVFCVEDAFRVLMEIFQGSQNEESAEYFKFIEKDIMRFGKNLKTNESVRFVESEKYARSDVVFELGMRRELADSYRSFIRAVGTGVLTGFRLNGTVFVFSEEYGSFACKIPSNAVKVGLDGHIGSEFEFVLTAELNHKGKIGRVEKCHRFWEVTKKEIISDRIDGSLRSLDEFAALGKGWLDGEGEEIDPASIMAARKFIEMTPGLAHKYIVAPSPEGYAGIEFAHEGWKICVNFTKDGINVLGYDLANSLDDFERFFKGLDSNLIEFASTAGGNLNAI